MIDASRLPTTITLLPTYRCTAACENCCFGSHPGITERIALERLLEHIDQAATFPSLRLVVFSGGECFTLGDDLVEAVRRAHGHGLATRCVTNAYWATSERRATERLKPLVEAGLTELNVSTGDLHQEFVPPRNVVNAAIAATGLALRTVVVIEARAGRVFSAAHLFSDERWSKLHADPEAGVLLTVIESPWMSTDAQTPVAQRDDRLVSRHNLQFRRGCDSVLKTMVVTPDERLGMCCGLTREQIPELHAGSLRDRSMADLYAEGVDDFMKVWIAVDGPERILAWAASKDPTIDWEDRFGHHCDACRHLYHDPAVRRVIEAHHHEQVDDVLDRFALTNPALTSPAPTNPAPVDDARA